MKVLEMFQNIIFRPTCRRRKTSVLNIILYQPEIPPNTGNIIRLCANTGASLHLVEPMGFVLDDTRVRRAGLDYHELARVQRYRNWPEFSEKNRGMNIWSFSTRGRKPYQQAGYRDNDGLLFGPETRGLPEHILALNDSQVLRIPMQAHSRSLNLSNTVAIVLYEALRQQGFPGLE
jgi:tRNA (cytidine/uridine-2'-O-)-methyltransferase